LTAEALGTFFLVMAVIGSGIMAAKLAGGNEAIALLCNTLPMGAVLFVIITIFISVYGYTPSQSRRTTLCHQTSAEPIRQRSPYVERIAIAI
jgi:hypothetical protein